MRINEISKVSVIMLCQNAKEYLIEAIETVQNQKHDGFVQSLIK